MHSYTNLFAVIKNLGTDSCSLAALGASDCHLASVNCAVGINDTAGLALSASLNVLVNTVNALNDNLVFLGGNCDYLMGDDVALIVVLFLILTCKKYYVINCFNFHFKLPPYSTSGARERILR